MSSFVLPVGKTVSASCRNQVAAAIASQPVCGGAPGGRALPIRALRG
jgi:hypothetical protein